MRDRWMEIGRKLKGNWRWRIKKTRFKSGKVLKVQLSKVAHFSSERSFSWRRWGHTSPLSPQYIHLLSPHHKQLHRAMLHMEEFTDSAAAVPGQRVGNCSMCPEKSWNCRWLSVWLSLGGDCAEAEIVKDNSWSNALFAANKSNSRTPVFFFFNSLSF